MMTVTMLVTVIVTMIIDDDKCVCDDGDNDGDNDDDDDDNDDEGIDGGDGGEDIATGDKRRPLTNSRPWPCQNTPNSDYITTTFE